MTPTKSGFFKTIFERIFPKSPDFFNMLNIQIGIIADISELMIDYMENNTDEVGEKIIEKEKLADQIKQNMLKELAEAFATPIDREDIYRAIIGIEDIANYSKATIIEMQDFGLKPDKYDLDIALHYRDGIIALKTGFSLLSTKPLDAVSYCDAARKEERRIEKIYRKALQELFVSSDFNYIFKRREVYRHVSNAADRLTSCANNLQDIIVKIS
ncbi:MAG: DUF47 family protein [Chitinophagales bacterium]|nr:DUF47 family protein [Chitinophagales bacterium]